MVIMTLIGEFAAEDVAGATAFVEQLPRELSRVYVEVWERDRWRFVYGDDRRYVSRLLGLVIHERRFRLRGIDLTSLQDGPPMGPGDTSAPMPPSSAR